VIGACSEVLRDSLPAGLDARELDDIDQAVSRAASLTHKLLAFSRKQVLQPRVIELNAVVSGMEDLLRRLIGENVQLVTALGGNLGRVKADPGQLEQVIMNLAVNARDAMPAGGRLIIETKCVHLQTGQVRPLAEGRYVVLSATDSGIGMDEVTAGRIFEPFFTTKESGKGTGLGLSTVYGIVHQSNGFIRVDSTLGQGTVFTIYLPRTATVAEAQDTPESLEAPAHGRETILLVEDDDGTRALISDVLKAYDYTILETGDPLEAIAIGEREPGPVHLLFTDVVMPGMRGPALAARLRALRPEIAVLYMSGYTDGTILARDTIESPGSFLQKPFTPAMIVHAVRDALDAASTRVVALGDPSPP
jgi:CheY-like chemotaxis protein